MTRYSLNRAAVLTPYYNLCISEAEFHGWLRSLRLPRQDWPKWINSGDETTHCLDNEANGQVMILVCIKTKPKISFVEICGLLIHESVHVWQHMRDGIGERTPSSEFEAYSIQNIAQSLIQAFQDKAKRKRK